MSTWFCNPDPGNVSVYKTVSTKSVDDKFFLRQLSLFFNVLQQTEAKKPFCAATVDIRYFIIHFIFWHVFLAAKLALHSLM